MTQIIQSAPRPARISAKLRRAIEIRVCEGKAITAACAEADISPAGWHRAMKRPAVHDLVEETQRKFVLSFEANRAVFRAQALTVARDLMLTAKSEAIRARMAEFLAGDGKASGGAVNVHIDARPERGGYEYIRPGQKLVEIEGQAADEPEPNP